MTFTEYRNLKKEIQPFVGVCKIFCQDCPLSESNNGKDVSCGKLEYYFPEVAEQLLQDWFDKRGTLYEQVKGIFPNMKLDENGVPAACPKIMDVEVKCYPVDCDECCKRFWFKKVK